MLRDDLNGKYKSNTIVQHDDDDEARNNILAGDNQRVDEFLILG